jgi:hypothetical protein
MSIYARLGFNHNDPTTNTLSTPYTSNVMVQMDLLPPLIKPWQANAIGNSAVSGFFVNPVANVAQLIWNTSNTLITLTSGLTASPSNPTVNTAMANVYATSTVLSTNTAQTYIYVTNKQSNVVPPDADTTTPHYSTAIAQGKMLSYITNQSDNISNSSVMLGSFTSVTLGNTLANLYSTMSTLTNILANTITYYTDPISGIPHNTTNVSTANARALQNVVSSVNYVMTFYPAQDSQFFQNSSNVLHDYGTVSQFNNMGQSQNYLLQNYIGSPTLLANLNS